MDILPNSWGNQHVPRRVTSWIEFDEGNAKATGVVYVPQAEYWNSMRVEVFEDGRRLDDLRSDAMGPVSTNHGAYNLGISEGFPALLFVDKDAPTPRNRRTVLQRRSAQNQHLLPDVGRCWPILPHLPGGSLRRGRSHDDAGTLDAVQQLSNVELIPPQELPTSWMGLTSIDVVFLELEDLQNLQARQPARFQALCQYVQTGPILVVSGIGQRFQRLDQLQTLLNLSDDDALWKSPAPIEEDDFLDSLTDFATIRDQYSQLYNRNPQAAEATYIVGSRMLTESEVQQGLERIGSALGSLAACGLEKSFADAGFGYFVSPNLVTSRMMRLRDTRVIFKKREMGFGQVVAVGPVDVLAEGEQQLNRLFENLNPRFRRYQRQGFSLLRDNPDYWKFLIPGVGAVPVKSYLVMISAFILLIGPLNYWLLQRNSKLYLLLITVPLGAGVVTSALFGYALLSDGFSTRARLRSVTRLDAKGSAVSWSRQTLYAALAPSGGLSFPSTAAVFPLSDIPTAAAADSKQHLVWNTGQRLSAGYIGSRSWSQLMVVYPQQTQARLAIDRRDDQLSVTNQLGTPVDWVVVADAGGSYFVAEDLADGQTARLHAVKNVGSLRTRLRRIRGDHRPVAPEGFNTGYNRRSFARSRRRQWSHLDSNFSPPSMSRGVMEQALSRGLSRLPQPGTFVAITTRAPDTVPVAYQRAREQDSLHLVLGDWKP